MVRKRGTHRDIRERYSYTLRMHTCVPYLQLDLVLIDVDEPRAKLDANRQIVHRLEALVGATRTGWGGGARDEGGDKVRVAE